VSKKGLPLSGKAEILGKNDLTPKGQAPQRGFLWFSPQRKLGTPIGHTSPELAAMGWKTLPGWKNLPANAFQAVFHLNAAFKHECVTFPFLLRMDTVG
jgi:hypothetical protein